jgi:hypothetical protein
MTPDQLAKLQAGATRPRRTVPIVLDGELRQRVEELVFELDQLQPAGDETPEPDVRLASRAKTKAKPNPRVAELQAELDALSVEVESKTMHVVVEGQPGTPFVAFRAAHPPREGNRADSAWAINVESSQEPLLRLTIVGHRDGETIHPVDVDWLLNWATEWQLSVLQIAALSVCRGDDAVPLPRRRSTTETSVGE